MVRTKGGACVTTVCSHNWNQTHSLEVIAPNQITKGKRLIQDPTVLYSVPVDFKIIQNAQKPLSDYREWVNQKLPSQNVNVLGGRRDGTDKEEDSFCELASPTNSITTFDGLTYNIARAGMLRKTIVRHWIKVLKLN